MAQKIYGIDVGTYSIKIAELESSFNNFELVSFYEHPVVYNEVLTAEEAIAATLEKMAEDYDLAEGQAYTALPGSYTSTRLLDMPFGNAKKVDQTIEFEVESAIPFALEDVVVDYHIVESSKTESTCLLSYAQKQDMVKFLNIFSGSEIEPRFVGCEPVELGSVMKLGMIQPEGAYAVLDLGHTKSNLAIYVGNDLYFSRTLSLGGLHLTQAIAEKLQVPVPEAERFKIEIGQLAGDAQDEMSRKISQAIKSVLNRLLIEVKQTFMNIQENEGQVIQALYLCGGTSRLNGIDHFFSYELRKNVSHLDCLDFSFNKLADSAWCRPIIPLSLALAYRGAVGKKLPDIQFRRGEFAYRGDMDQLSGIAKQAAVIGATIAFFVMVSFGVNYFVLNSKLDKFKGSVAEAAGKVLPTTPTRMLESTDSVLSILNSKILEGREVKKEISEKFDNSYLNILKEVSRVLPPRDQLKLDIDELSIAGNRLRMEGRTVSFESVDIIKTSIAKSQYFKNVSTGNVTKAADNLIKFNITLQIDSEPEAVGLLEGGH